VGGALADTCLTDVFSLVVGLPNQCKGFLKKGPVLHPAGPSMTLQASQKLGVNSVANGR